MSSCRLPSACRISVIYCFYELSAHRLLHAAWIFLAFLKDWMRFQSNFYQSTDMTQYSMIPPGKTMWTFFDVSARSQNPRKIPNVEPCVDEYIIIWISKTINSAQSSRPCPQTQLSILIRTRTFLIRTYKIKTLIRAHIHKFPFRTHEL